MLDGSFLTYWQKYFVSVLLYISQVIYIQLEVMFFTPRTTQCLGHILDRLAHHEYLPFFQPSRPHTPNVLNQSSFMKLLILRVYFIYLQATISSSCIIMKTFRLHPSKKTQSKYNKKNIFRCEYFFLTPHFNRLSMFLMQYNKLRLKILEQTKFKNCILSRDHTVTDILLTQPLLVPY